MAKQRIIHIGGDVLPVHKPFHASTARYKAAIGGVGSGKSRALCMEAIRFALAQPGSDMFLTRRYVPALKDSTEAVFFDVLPAELKSACKITRQQNHVESIRFPNYSLLKFRGMEDWETHKSQNLAWIGVDEADEQIAANIFGGIDTRLRQTKPLQGAPRLPAGQIMLNQLVLACNPAGQNWIWEAFVNPATRRPDSSVHLSTPFDNPYLPQAYLDALMKMPAALIRRYVYCQFDAAAGRVYEDWAWDTHVLPDMAPGHYGQAIWMAMDPGVLSPTAGLWAEVDHLNGRLVAVSEYMEPGRAAGAHADAWRRLEAGFKPARVVRRIADPSIAKRDQGTTMELADIYGRLGFNFERGPVRQDIRIPALANLIATRQFVCTTGTPRLHDQIMNARWQDQVPRLRDLGEFQEKIKKGNDHLHDTAQYLASAYVAPRKPLVKPPEPPSTHDEIREAWEAERRAKHAKRIRAGRRPAALPDGVIC